MSEPKITWDDLHLGDVRDCGTYTFTRDEIMRFAREWDPQPFHLDEEAARRSPYGGVIASGWHTACVAMRLAVEGMIRHTASMGSPGVDELRWLAPVRPDDTLSLRCEIIELTPSRTKTDRGSLRLRYELRNQRGELVLTMVGIGIIGRRAAD